MTANAVAIGVATISELVARGGCSDTMKEDVMGTFAVGTNRQWTL